MAVYRLVGLDRSLSYDDFFCLWLNTDSANHTTDFHNAVSTAVGCGQSKMPAHWITAAVKGTSGIHQWKNWDWERTMKS